MHRNSNAHNYGKPDTDGDYHHFRWNDLFRQQHNADCFRWNILYLDAGIAHRSNSNSFSDEHNNLHRYRNQRKRLHQHSHTHDYRQPEPDRNSVCFQHEHLHR